jgi:hypothetical protein
MKLYTQKSFKIINENFWDLLRSVKMSLSELQCRNLLIKYKSVTAEYFKLLGDTRNLLFIVQLKALRSK